MRLRYYSSPKMNLKLENESRRESTISSVHNVLKPKKSLAVVKEERRRTGRYIAILVGILLFLLATYHAWVRRIPVIASLVVPALIMFIYVGWVLYTASRDKKRALALDAEAALQEMAAALENEKQDDAAYNMHTEHIHTEGILCDAPSVDKDDNRFIMIKPIILINGQVPDDFEQDLTAVTIISAVKRPWQQREFVRRKFKRKFCRKKRSDIFKRSYSIA